MAAPTSSKALTLHTSRAAASIGDTRSLTEKSRSDKSWGSLENYANAWNNSNFTEVTFGLGKDIKPIVDPRGLRPMYHQLARHRHCMRQTDTAWYNVEKNITVNISFPR
jgi:hypothetical protein